MTARVLVVDDIDANIRLLEARLMAEYFQVLTATNGADALEICAKGQCDIVLLDVMMPQMDGFEVCRRLKSNPKTMHIPVVMVTALDQVSDRIKGLECGADDFLTKPLNDLALMTRVKSLVRLKMVTDELRLRASNGQELDVDEMGAQALAHIGQEKPKLLLVDDAPSSYERLLKYLNQDYRVTLVTDPNEALFRAADEAFDISMISLSIQNTDALRLCSQLRSLERTRTLPIMILASTFEEEKVMKAMDLGVNDYVMRPIDRQELAARLNTQIKRKNYELKLRDSVQQTIEMAVTDSLTGLNNRRYFDQHLDSTFKKAQEDQKPLSLIICDIDHFKAVNDTHGHDVGDEVIKEFSARIKKNIRNIDLACRYGGEEFAIIMPDTSQELAGIVAERIRANIEKHPFIAANGSKQLPITVSIGVSCVSADDGYAEKILKRADVALYNAKRSGRNQVMIEEVEQAA